MIAEWSCFAVLNKNVDGNARQRFDFVNGSNFISFSSVHSLGCPYIISPPPVIPLWSAVGDEFLCSLHWESSAGPFEITHRSRINEMTSSIQFEQIK